VTGGDHLNLSNEKVDDKNENSFFPILQGESEKHNYLKSIWKITERVFSTYT